MYFERTSGVPFTYVAQGDLNGDLYNGNDPIYIPRNTTDPEEIVFSGTAAAAATQAAAFERFISSQSCLDRQRGQIMERNSCRTPGQTRMDVSIRQSIPRLAHQQLTLQLDVFNFLNLINQDWGQIKLPTLSPTFNDQRALVVTARSAGPLSQSQSTFTFDNRLYQSDVTKGNFGGPRPFEGRSGSVYQVQLMLRYSF